MVKKSIIQTIRDKEMDRKEFLKYSGIALLSIVGLKGLTALLTVSDEKVNNSSNTNAGHGFGGGKYGA